MNADSIGRRFKSLRLSLTAACNYACTYCVPNGKRLVAAQDELSVEEIVHAVTILVKVAGIKKLRITGGEPLISKKLSGVLSSIKHLHLDDVSLTTNGQFLLKNIDLLLDNNVKRINVSLDTLDAMSFRAMARGGDLPTVLRGLESAKYAGMSVKINMVPIRSQNINQVLPLMDYCLENSFELRFIELMRMGHLRGNGTEFDQQFVGRDELLKIIGSHYSVTPANAPSDSTALRYQVTNNGFFGVIANESAPFCRTCTRLRLSSTGWIHGCLSSGNKHYIGSILKQSNNIAGQEIRRVLGAALRDKQATAFTGGELIMKSIGG